MDIVKNEQNFQLEASSEDLSLEQLKHNFIGKNNWYLRRGIPESHRKIADNFMIIKKIFGYPVVHSKITKEEQEFLAKYDFNQLEFTTAKQIEEEIVFLKKWSFSRSPELQEASDTIMKIRVKELKYLIATKYVDITDRIYNGHEVLANYLEDISKYFIDSF